MRKPRITQIGGFTSSVQMPQRMMKCEWAVSIRPLRGLGGTSGGEHLSKPLNRS